MRRLFLLLLPGLLLSGALHAETLVMEGVLDSKMQVKEEVHFAVDHSLKEVGFRFALPARFSTTTVSQDVSDFTAWFDPKPSKVDDETDVLGNRFKTATWKNVKRDIRVAITYTSSVKSDLLSLESKSAYPLVVTERDAEVYLRPTEMVQSAHPEIITLARQLTGDAATEYAAVTAVIHYVSDTVNFVYGPQRIDALSTLREKSGNCTNIAHLSCALLRAAGIPSRIVGGIGLKEHWKVPIPEGNLVQGLGQGGHAWIEVYFPDLGWLPYDPQQSKQFTSSRHIKQTHGLDSSSIADSWWGIPSLPKYTGTLDARFIKDVVSLKLKTAEKLPRTYLVANQFVTKLVTAEQPIPKVFAEETVPLPARAEEAPAPPAAVIDAPPAPPPAPPVVEAKPEPVVPPAMTEEWPQIPPSPERQPGPVVVEFGNTALPALLELYRIEGNRGIRTFEAETAEYVTSREIYAQAFHIDETHAFESVSLGLRRFGGDGVIYVDVVRDENGKPGLTGARSSLIFLEKMPRKQGYYWVDFTFSPDTPVVLGKGKYWIILRHSGEAVVNWFYTPAKRYGEAWDTRSTSRGYQWEDILNYDFIFEIKAKKMSLSKKIVDNG